MFHLLTCQTITRMDDITETLCRYLPIITNQYILIVRPMQRDAREYVKIYLRLLFCINCQLKP